MAEEYVLHVEEDDPIRDQRQGFSWNTGSMLRHRNENLPRALQKKGT